MFLSISLSQRYLYENKILMTLCDKAFIMTLKGLQHAILKESK